MLSEKKIVRNTIAVVNHFWDASFFNKDSQTHTTNLTFVHPTTPDTISCLIPPSSRNAAMKQFDPSVFPVISTSLPVHLSYYPWIVSPSQKLLTAMIRACVLIDDVPLATRLMERAWVLFPPHLFFFFFKYRNYCKLTLSTAILYIFYH